ncbi:UNVERIFIED_CONTAM: decapping enzyme subunit [Sesamum latifolium]|uniref:Decapping enzyme subunit n=1 Tax=Sesamum latifolium TaxID=2727402 RepID=A0AAW2XDL1_9LAMI
MSGALHRSSSAPSKNALPPQELLDDLCSRFVLNVPKEDQQSFERILFLVEYAHWFYEDNSVEKNPSLKSLTLKEFTSLLFNNCDVLKPYVAHIDDIFKDFTSYKVRVPVTGAIILDETYERCLLVKGWKGSSWSFPRGKKSKDEEDHKCAIRECPDSSIVVMTSQSFIPSFTCMLYAKTYELLLNSYFDWYRSLRKQVLMFSKLLNKDEYIEMIFGQQRVRLYIVAGVKDDTAFAPLTKKEISEIAWQRIDELQPTNDDVISRGITGLKLYMVAPFLASLRSWISVHPPPVTPRSDNPRKGITVWKAKNSSIGNSSYIAVENQPSKAVADMYPPPDTFPVRSFLNFRFDTGPILQAVDAAFST